MTTTARLLICSIGNPGSTYANTLHSAGHTVLNRLAESLNSAPFRKDRDLAGGLVTHGPSPATGADWTLWQSPLYMNESGKGVQRAFTAWSRQSVPVGDVAKLIVVYDELEKPLGSVTVRTQQGLSAKGHNGLKSLMASLGGSVPFTRIGVGIGRPVSRDSDDVSRYVLRKMTAGEKTAVEGCVDEVVKRLVQLERG